VYVADAADGGISFIGTSISSNQAKSYRNAKTSSCYGGGVYIADGNVDFDRCWIGNNSTYAYANNGYSTDYAYSYGGGVYINTGGFALMRNTVIPSNSCTASADYTYKHGAGVLVYSSALYSLNNTIVNNLPEGVYNGGVAILHSSIIYSNSSTQIYDGGATKVNYCCIQDGWPSGEGNISDDPQFIIQPPFDYSLQPGSPCIDAGDPDTQFNDVYMPPSQGNLRNDMGWTGGPLAGYDAIPDLRINGMDGPLFMLPIDNIELSIMIDKGHMEGETVDIWIGAITPFGGYWLNPTLNWVYSEEPVHLITMPIIDLAELTILSSKLPETLYTFFMILDDIPNGKFDSLGWYDIAVLDVSWNNLSMQPPSDEKQKQILEMEAEVRAWLNNLTNQAGL
jgi:hypothetical protein